MISVPSNLMKTQKELLLIKTAQILSQNNVIDIPEIIRDYDEETPIPQIITGEYNGLRVIFEGNVNDNDTSQKKLEELCRQRLTDGIGAIITGIQYTDHLVNTPWQSLGVALLESNLDVMVFTENGEFEWSIQRFEDFSIIFERVFLGLVQEDIVKKSVELLQNAIEISSPFFSTSKISYNNLKKLLLNPKVE